MKMNVKDFLKKSSGLLHNKNVIDLTVRFIIFALLLIGVYFLIDKFQKKQVRFLDTNKKRSSLHDGSSGTMALKELLQSLGIKTENIMDPLISYKDKSFLQKSTQNNERKGSVILVAEPETFLNEKDLSSIKNIVSMGNTMLIFSDNIYILRPFLTNEFIKSNQLFMLEDKKNEEDNDEKNNITASNEETIVSLTEDSFLIWNDLKKLELKDKLYFTKWSEQWKALAKHKGGAIVLEQSIDQGKIVLVSDSSILSNYYIGKEDNSIFVYRLLKHYLDKYSTDIVYFDEFHHGFHRKFTLLFFISKSEYFFILLQILVFFGFLFYTLGRHFGQYHRDIRMEQKRIYYFTEGMAGLLARHKFVPDIAQTFVNDFRKLVQLRFYRFDRNTEAEINSIIESNKDKKTKYRVIKKLIGLIKGAN